MPRALAALAALACLTAIHVTAAPAAPDLTTEAERSGYRRTGRYDEVARLCDELPRAFPRKVACTSFGVSPEGRKLLALVASADGALTPAEARARGRAAIVVQAGIHAGEIEGKDAGFAVLRELLEGKLVPGVLGKVTFVFVPIFNVDGAERFGPNNRPNQRGPAEMGFRTTAQNLNLNRDYVKADSPEMRAMLGLLDAWDPILYVDLHTTDGAKFQPDVSVIVAPDEPRPDGLEQVGRRLSDAVQARLRALKHLPVAFYPDFRAEDDPASGFALYSTPPRFSEAYAATRNRLGVLVETHSWKPYAQRVAATHDTLQALLERAAVDVDAWRSAAADSDAKMQKLGGTEVVLATAAGETSHPIDFPGYAYVIRTSDVSGRSWIVYDETRPETWHVPFFDQPRPELTVRAPRGGYLIPVAHAAWLAPLLRLHGLRFDVLARPLEAVHVEGFHVSQVTYEPPHEGRTPAQVKGAWQPATQSLPAGSIFVPMAQPRSLLVLHLLEPEAPDSLASWGFFNAVFEQKEYMEAYVLEAEARRMLAADPKLKAEFEQRLHDDSAFAASADERLRFFYQRHPAWDDRIAWVPIYRVDQAP